MSNNTSMGQSLSDLGQVMNGLIGIQRSFAEEVFKLVGSSGDMLTGSLRNALGSLDSLTSSSCCGTPGISIPQLTRSCCDIPEPCWMPRCLGEFNCLVCPGSSATIRVRITNEDIRPRTMVALASGSAAKDVTFTPQSLHLGPKEQGSITAALNMPANAKDGESAEAIIWVRGCRDYYIRWTVTAGSRSGCCAHEVNVCDGPDNILHWYDHFYCPRPCLGGGRAG